MIGMFGWNKDDRGSYTYAFETKDGHKHVISVSEIQGKWQFVWTRRGVLTLAERSGFTTLELCMAELWRTIFEAQDERINLSVEHARRIVEEGERKARGQARYTVQLTYFRPDSGAYYGAATYETERNAMHEIFVEVQRLFNASTLPGLPNGHGPLLVLAEVPLHPHNYKHLIGGRR